MAAEDLELMLKGLASWRRSGGDLFDAICRVEARGPTYLEATRSGRVPGVRDVIRIPKSAQLAPSGLTEAEAALLVLGVEKSAQQAVDDVLALAAALPWDIRDAMIRYKHGFMWILSEVTPLRTDAVGAGFVERAPPSAFIVPISASTGVLFDGDDGAFAEAKQGLALGVELTRFVVEMILTECESRDALCGVALYGDSKADAAQRALEQRVVAWIRRR